MQQQRLSPETACPAETPTTHLCGATSCPAFLCGVALGWQWASQQSLQRKWGHIGKENPFAAQVHAGIKSNATDVWWQQLGGRQAGQAGVPVESLCALTERQACWHTGLPGLSLQWDLLAEKVFFPLMRSTSGSSCWLFEIIAEALGSWNVQVNTSCPCKFWAPTWSVKISFSSRKVITHASKWGSLEVR